MRALALIALSATTLSGVSVDVSSMTVNGLEVAELRCELDKAGLMASLMVVSTLSESKPALDACAPSGGAFEVEWTWGASASAKAVRGLPKDKMKCVGKALQSIETDLVGQCSALVLVGEPEGAKKAATLKPPAEPPAEPAPVKPAEPAPAP